MKARGVVAREPGGPDVLDVVSVDVPDPGPGQLRVRVWAAGLNRADLLQRRGFYPAPPGSPAEVLGLEFSGEVESLGAGATRFRVGDNVMGLVGGGGMCELLCLHEREAVPVPPGMSHEQSAAIPEAFMTAHDALFSQGRLATSEWVLIHAVASGVGSAAAQLVRAAGARAIGTLRTESKLARLRTLGLAAVFVIPEGKFAERCQSATGGSGVDLVVDLVGASYLEENLAAMAPRARMIVLGLMGGTSAEIPLGALLGKRLTVTGSTLRARPLEEKIAVARAFETHALPLFTAGGLEPMVDEVFPVEKIRLAHERMEDNQNVGKIVVTFP